MKSLVVILFILASAGLLFSGYLSAVNLFSHTCAFNESCPFFLGYPACFYGFAMYLVMFFVTGLGVLGRVRCGQSIVSANPWQRMGCVLEAPSKMERR